MFFVDGKAFAIELQRAFDQYKAKPERDSVRWLNQCLEGLRYLPAKAGCISVLNWHEGRAVDFLRLDATPENVKIVDALKSVQSTIKAVFEGETEDFDGEYSGTGKYAKSRIWTTVQLLNPIDSQSYSVSHILPLSVRIRLGIQ